MFSSLFFEFLIFGTLLVLKNCQLVESRQYTVGNLLDPPGWNINLVSRYQPPLLEDPTPLPISFDARTHWPDCTDVISRIGNQRACGSCWAFATAHVISDRICIASNGKQKPWISAQDLMECSNVHNITDRPGIKLGQACAGGNPSAAFEHYVTKGVVTGSTHDSVSGCKPYLFANGLRDQDQYPYTPMAQKMMLSCVCGCENVSFEIGNYTQPKQSKEKYQADLHFGKNHEVLLMSNDTEQADVLKRIILKDGPVSALINGGILNKESSFAKDERIIIAPSQKTTHAIRVIGWGTSDKHGNYWIIANSWGKDWNSDGTAKVAFGAAAFGDQVAWAMPKL